MIGSFDSGEQARKREERERERKLISQSPQVERRLVH